MKRRTVLCVSVGTLSLAGCLSQGDGTGDERLDARGEISVVIDGDQVDLSAARFQSEHASTDSADFHLHEGSDEWFMEGTSAVTVAEAIDFLPHFAFEGRDGTAVVTIDERTYDASESDTTIDVRVDDSSVDATAHELADGERIELTISTDGGEAADRTVGG